MGQEILKLKKWRKTQKNLLKFIEIGKKVSGDEIRDWVARCVVHFTEINMNQSIVSYFLSKLEYNEKKVELDRLGYRLSIINDENECNIGPFVFDHVGQDGYTIRTSNRLNLKTGGRVHMTPILVAFKVAENIINNHEEEERLIPSALISEFSEKIPSISIALENIQNSYEKKNIKGMLTSLITTTNLICNLIPEISQVEKLGPKIRKIYESKAIYDKYNISRDILWALNNSRIIRNYDIHDPKEINHTTLHEAVGYSHILVLFLNSLLSSGEMKLA